MRLEFTQWSKKNVKESDCPKSSGVPSLGPGHPSPSRCPPSQLLLEKRRGVCGGELDPIPVESHSRVFPGSPLRGPELSPQRRGDSGPQAGWELPQIYFPQPPQTQKPLPAARGKVGEAGDGGRLRSRQEV